MKDIYILAAHIKISWRLIL